MFQVSDNTHKSSFKLNQLPFGLKVAPSLFQQIMDTMLAGLEFAIAYLDDILVKSKNMDEHNKTHKGYLQENRRIRIQSEPPKNVNCFYGKN